MIGQIRAHSLWSMILVRIFPVAPSSLIGILSGLFAIPLWKFLLGSTIGIIPGAIALVFFQKGLYAFIHGHDLGGLTILAATVIFITLTYRPIKNRFSAHFKS